MMLLNVMVRLLAVVAITGLWVGPAVCMDNVSQIINSSVTEPATISVTDKMMFYENTDQEALSNSVVSSKVLPRSAFDTKELMKIFNIAYTNNESRVLSQPLNYYELPDGEFVKRDFRSVKYDNVVAESQEEGFSSAPWVADNTLNAEKDKSVTNFPVNENPVHTNEDVFSAFVSEVGEVTDAMVNTITFFTSALENTLEKLGAKVLEFGNTTVFDIIIFLVILGCVSVAIILFICYKILLTLPQKPLSCDCDAGQFSNTMKKVYLTITLDSDNNISCIDVHANEVKHNNGNN